MKIEIVKSLALAVICKPVWHGTRNRVESRSGGQNNDSIDQLKVQRVERSLKYAIREKC